MQLNDLTQEDQQREACVVPWDDLNTHSNNGSLGLVRAFSLMNASLIPMQTSPGTFHPVLFLEMLAFSILLFELDKMTFAMNPMSMILCIID